MSKYRVISGPYFSVFSPNIGKYGPEITPYMDTFYALNLLIIFWWMLDLNSHRLTSWACYRSNHPEIFHEIDVFKNFAKFTGKHLYQSLEFCEIFKNIFFYRISTVAASVATPNLVNSKSNFVLIFEHQCLFFDLVVLLLLRLLLLFYFGRNQRLAAILTFFWINFL